MHKLRIFAALRNPNSILGVSFDDAKTAAAMLAKDFVEGIGSEAGNEDVEVNVLRAVIQRHKEAYFNNFSYPVPGQNIT
jgi:hypothetical protein